MSGHQGRKQQQLGRLPVYFILALIGVVISALATTCSGGGGGHHSRNTAAPPPAQPFQELYDQGIDRYLGIYTPMLSEEKDGVFTHTFGSGDGIDDRFQRGLHNLSAGLDMAMALFPAPRRVVLVGTSAGGLGACRWISSR
jgi:hypothetical protein